MSAVSVSATYMICKRCFPQTLSKKASVALRLRAKRVHDHGGDLDGGPVRQLTSDR
jgi:hypothetical protein